MKVFISWSGFRSKHIAEALHRWIPLVLQNVEPWVSRHDIEAGARWGAELDQSLESTNYGILILTPGHVDKPWLMYEAGSLGKFVDVSRVVPYCFEMTPTDIPAGPLQRFNGVTADLDGTRKLIDGMALALQRDSERAPTEKQIDRLLGTFWPQLEAELDATPPETGSRPELPALPEMVREILALSRETSRIVAAGGGGIRFDAASETRMLTQIAHEIIQRDPELHDFDAKLALFQVTGPLTIAVLLTYGKPPQQVGFTMLRSVDASLADIHQFASDLVSMSKGVIRRNVQAS